MIYKVLTIKDKAIGAFGRPVFAASIGSAMRSFRDEVNRKGDNNDMYNHSDDFELFDLGEFDDDVAHFTLHLVPVLITNGTSVKES